MLICISPYDASLVPAFPLYADGVQFDSRLEIATTLTRSCPRNPALYAMLATSTPDSAPARVLDDPAEVLAAGPIERTRLAVLMSVATDEASIGWSGARVPAALSLSAWWYAAPNGSNVA